jgi:HK97 gp10 family phage protein
MSPDVKIIGLDKLIHVLNKLPDRTSYRILISALKRAAKPVRKRARQLVPKRTRNLMKSISIFPSKNKDFPAAWIGPLTGKRKRFDGWYAHFVHFGTKGFGKRKTTTSWDRNLGQALKYSYVYTTKSGRYKYITGYSKKGGGLKATPFMTDAFTQTKDEAFGMIHKELSNSVVKFMQKNLPK